MIRNIMLMIIVGFFCTGCIGGNDSYKNNDNLDGIFECVPSVAHPGMLDCITN